MRKSFEEILSLNADDFAKYFNSRVATTLGRKAPNHFLTAAEADSIKEGRRDLYEKIKTAKDKKNGLAFTASVKEIYPFLEEAHIESATRTLTNSATTAVATTMHEISHLSSLLNTDSLMRIASYLPLKSRVQLTKTSSFMSRELKGGHKRQKFLHHVARGQQEQAEAMLVTDTSLLIQAGEFTDYSARRFNCTAYEYAYWAKDTHMRRMLESHMNEEIKAFLREKIDTLESIDPATSQAKGLSYWQHGFKHQHAHCDLTPLKNALQRYVDIHVYPRLHEIVLEMTEAWLAIGKAQREVPAHVAQEYCRPDRPFHPAPVFFNDEALPRTLLFRDYYGGMTRSWFPLDNSWYSYYAHHPGKDNRIMRGDTSTFGLGFNFSLIRADRVRAQGAPFDGHRVSTGISSLINATIDLAAVSLLDIVRTADLRISREYLKPSAISPGPHR